MKTEKELNEAIEILNRYPRLKEIITPGIDITTVLSKSAIKSLNRDEFLALCSLPLDMAIPGSVRGLFIAMAKEYGAKVSVPESKMNNDNGVFNNFKTMLTVCMENRVLTYINEVNLK
jgi:hypothetical protein